MKKVLHLRSSGAILGAENVVLELARNTVEFGFESHVGAIHNDNDPYPEFLKSAQQIGLETVVFGGNGRADLKRLSAIKQYIAQNDIDIVHSHGYKEDFYCTMLPNSVARVATNHLWKRNSPMDHVYCLMDAIFLQFFDIVAGVSSEIIKSMRSFGIQKSIMIANGIDCIKFQPADKKSPEYMSSLNLPDNKTVIGMISSLTPEKGHKTAIKAIELCKDKEIILLIVGDGELRNELQKMVDETGLHEQVLFAGRQFDIPAILSVIDIFLLPSFREGLPMALLEAMASGKPVIATRVGEIPFVIEDKKNGILIDAADPKQIADAIGYLLDKPYEYKALGEEARKRIVQQYSASIMVGEYCKLYESVLKKAKSA